MRKKDTEVTTAGRDPERQFGAVNPPIVRASTIAFPTVADMDRAKAKPFDSIYYGRHGTPTTFAFEDAIARLEGGYRAIACSSGLAAINVALTAFVSAGDHILVTDSVYDPARRNCEVWLKRLGVETTFYDPRIGAGIRDLIRPNTKVVFTESPGSLTFEVQDIPAIAEAAHAKGAVVILDNTWATPLYFQPFAHGVDVSIEAATKYIAGHSDVMLGVVTTTEKMFLPVKRQAAILGACAGPDDCALGSRGLRTLAVRLERHGATGLKLAEWLKARPEVARVIHPALPESPDHPVWKRDFLGTSGLFAVVLKPYSKTALAAFLDHLELFAMGFSWGGFESLILPVDPTPHRTAVPWKAEGPLVRIHAGLENVGDLIADLATGFERMKKSD
ncbi:MAG: cystathionine beta-lyase [Gemmatimonas sp.]